MKFKVNFGHFCGSLISVLHWFYPLVFRHHLHLCHLLGCHQHAIELRKNDSRGTDPLIVMGGQVYNCGVVTAGVVDENIEWAVNVLKHSSDFVFKVSGLLICYKTCIRPPVGIEFVENAVELLAETFVTAFVSFLALVDVLLHTDVLRSYPRFAYEFVYTFMLAVGKSDSHPGVV